MLSRRGLLATASLLSLPALLSRPRPARAGADTIKVGLLPFGTASWEAAVIKARGLDAANGFTLEPVKLAGNDAARIAFQGGQVDTVVGDLIWAARLRAEDGGTRFTPYSTTEGALMVPGNSPVRSLGDLAGRRLGVAGGALDKNWILLKAQARESGGIDLEASAQLAFGAAPLLMQKLETGELDAALLYWQHCARLEPKGFKRLISADDIMRAFGARGPVALIGYMFGGQTIERSGEAVRGFARASMAAKDILANDAEAWSLVRPLMAAEDDPTFEVLKRDFLSGIPRRPLVVEREDAGRVYATLARLGGTQLVGNANTLPAGLYLDETRNG